MDSDFRQLLAFRKSYKLAMEIFEISKNFLRIFQKKKLIH